MWQIRWLIAAALLALPGCSGNAANSAGTKTSEVEQRKPPVFRDFHWSDASREVRHGDVALRIDGVYVGPVKTRLDDGEFEPTDDKYLVVQLTLTYEGDSPRRRYTGWGSVDASLNGHLPRLMDGNDRRYKAVVFQDEKVEGQQKSTRLRPNRPLSDVLVFAAPPDDAGALRLELPAVAFDGKGHVRLEIPAEAIDR